MDLPIQPCFRLWSTLVGPRVAVEALGGFVKCTPCGTVTRASHYSGFNWITRFRWCNSRSRHGMFILWVVCTSVLELLFLNFPPHGPDAVL